MNKPTDTAPTDGDADTGIANPLQQDATRTCGFCGRRTVSPCQTMTDMLGRAAEGDALCRDTMTRVGGGESFPNPTSATIH